MESFISTNSSYLKISGDLWCQELKVQKDKKLTPILVPCGCQMSKKSYSKEHFLPLFEKSTIEKSNFSYCALYILTI